MKKRGLLAAIIFILLVPSAASITLQDLISFFSFDFFTAAINVTNYNDFMIDQDNNGINDTLILELTVDGNSGNYLIAVDLHDNYIITNETNKSLAAGISKFNISFSTGFLAKNKFNYTIKIYGGDYSLKYSKENIETNNYANYEEGVEIISISDKAINISLSLNLTANFTKANDYEIISYLEYNGSKIFSKINQLINPGVSSLIMNFGNETIKNTHYIGKFNLTSVRINNKVIKTSYTTNIYDYRDFAHTSYISGFSDYGFDEDNNRVYDLLRLNATLEIKNDGTYNVEAALYDLFDNFIGKTDKTEFFSAGASHIILDFNGTGIYDKKFNGPYIVKYAKLAQNSSITDNVNDFYTTQNYNYTNFEKSKLPDLNISIEIPDDANYGLSNFSINITLNNIGNKNAFNVFLEIFDNSTYSTNKSVNILSAGDYRIYSIDFTNAADFDLNAIADFDDFVEESNESNNIIKETIKINKRPVLDQIDNITVNETDTVIITANATDGNSDALTFSVNNTKFSQDSSNFSWHTTTMDSGNYMIKINASDGYLHDSGVFGIIVLDMAELDSDNDGINDSLDRVIGEPDLINTSTLNLSFFIGNSSNLSKVFNGTQKIEFKDSSTTVVEFDFNFSNATINLNNVIMNKQSDNSTGAIVFSIRNTTLPAGFAKTIYLDKINQSENGICIRDMEVISILELSGSCNQENEHEVECDGTLQDGYNCTYLNTTKKYKITGLKNSGIKQIDFEQSTDTTASAASGSGGGGGSSSLCTGQWSCTEWSECVDDMQARACNDLSQCRTALNKPAESRECQTTESEKQPFSTGSMNPDGTDEKANGKIKPFPKITGFFSSDAEADPRIGSLIALSTVAVGLFAFYIFQLQLKIFK